MQERTPEGRRQLYIERFDRDVAQSVPFVKDPIIQYRIGYSGDNYDYSLKSSKKVDEWGNPSIIYPFLGVHLYAEGFEKPYISLRRLSPYSEKDYKIYDTEEEANMELDKAIAQYKKNYYKETMASPPNVYPILKGYEDASIWNMRTLEEVHNDISNGIFK